MHKVYSGVYSGEYAPEGVKGYVLQWGEERRALLALLEGVLAGWAFGEYITEGLKDLGRDFG